MIEAVLILTAAIQLADSWLTYHLLGRPGMSERTGWIAWLIERFGRKAVYGPKLFGVAALLAVYLIGGFKHPAWIPALLVFNFLYGMRVTLHNYRLYRTVPRG